MTNVDYRLAGRHSGSTVRLPKAAELVAAQLRTRIIGGDVGDGDELPRESDLLAEFGVSRPSLREALRILETEGLILVRRGRDGGAIARRPTAASAAYHLGLTLQAREVTLSDLALARRWIEPICTELVASLPDRQAAVDELTALVDESEHCASVPEYTEAAHAFHLRLTELAGSTTMAVLAGALEALWSAQETHLAAEQVRAGTPDTPAGIEARPKSVAAHRRLIALIAAGDAAGAREEMRQHLEEMSAVLTDEVGGTAPMRVIPPGF
jgi:DNA-binding FadR family transcriptional regulator